MSKQLTTHEKDQLLEFFRYYMSMELRVKLINELPQAYNHLVGDDPIAKVVAVDDGREFTN